MDQKELESFLINVLEEYFAPKPCPLAKKWEGGSLILKPGNDSEAKEIPLEVFLRKILTVRDSLRVLEQKLNGHEGLSPTEKASFQNYITKAYGALTTFNVLFKDGKDRFHGSGGGGGSKKPEMTLSEAKKKLGLNEY